MKRFLSLILVCVLFLSSCQPVKTDEITVSGKVAGLIDNHTVEMMLSDGSIESFLFFDETVGENLSAAEESETEITLVCVEKDGQQLKEIIRVE